MKNYQNGKIYAIKSNETDDVYIGSTCSTLPHRFCCHKSEYKRMLKGDKPMGTRSREILKYADARIELIENFPCGNEIDLLHREGHFQRITPNCVNNQIQGRTMFEYRQDNREKLKEQGKVWVANNRDKVRASRKVCYARNKDRLNANRRKKTICPLCVDVQIELEYKTQKEHNLTFHPEMLKAKKSAQDKLYRDVNAEKVKNRKNQKVVCPHCQKEITSSNLPRHIKKQH